LTIGYRNLAFADVAQQQAAARDLSITFVYTPLRLTGLSTERAHMQVCLSLSVFCCMVSSGIAWGADAISPVIFSRDKGNLSFRIR
jgi:hypothetical protein